MVFGVFLGGLFREWFWMAVCNLRMSLFVVSIVCMRNYVWPCVGVLLVKRKY